MLQTKPFHTVFSCSVWSKPLQNASYCISEGSPGDNSQLPFVLVWFCFGPLMSQNWVHVHSSQTYILAQNIKRMVCHRKYRPEIRGPKGVRWEEKRCLPISFTNTAHTNLQSHKAQQKIPAPSLIRTHTHFVRNSSRWDYSLRFHNLQKQ